MAKLLEDSSINFSLVITYLLVITQILSTIAAEKQQQVCGKPKDGHSQENISQKARLGSWPWHATIFEYNSSYENLTNICCGTIISSHIIITAANCVYDEDTLKKKDAILFKVTVGKLSHKWNEPDRNSQELQVSSIHILDAYVGNVTSYEQNVALLGLSNDIEFNDAVRPICLDWDGKHWNKSSSYAKIAGWGLGGHAEYDDKLQLNQVQYIPRRDCIKSFSDSPKLKYLKFGKFCIITGKGRKDKDTGAGVVFSYGDTYYLRGILDINIKSEFTLATNISTYLPWLKQKIADINKEKRCPSGFMCSDSNVCIEAERKCDGNKDCEDGSDENETICGNKKAKGLCVLPYQKGGATYKILGCEVTDIEQLSKCEKKPLERVYVNTKIRISCGLGYAPTRAKTDLAICTPEGWFPADLKCIRLCQSLVKENVEVKCTFKGETNKCKDYVWPGTIAKYNCQKQYKIKHPSSFSGFSQCLASGQWTEQLPECVAECGYVNKFNEATPTVAGGNDATYGKYPWHVGIFQKFDYNSSYVNICGGSIISTNLVLTAAHCFFDKKTKKVFDVETMAVAAGKFKRDWYHQESYQQSSLINKFILPDTFTGFANRYEHDIALLDIKVPFVLNDFVLPVCLDWHGTGILPGTNGTIIGWGFNEKQVYSENLQEITLSIVDVVTCRAKFDFFTTFLTYDKFCAIYKDGYGGARAGDSGGSMTFPKNDIYYAHGVVSLKPTRDDRFGALTNVSEHIEWIKQHLKHNPSVKLVA